MTSLELAVRFGKTLIIQEMDGVEPVLYPLLRRDLIAQGPRKIPFSYQVAAVKIMDSALQLQGDSEGWAAHLCSLLAPPGVTAMCEPCNALSDFQALPEFCLCSVKDPGY